MPKPLSIVLAVSCMTVQMPAQPTAVVMQSHAVRCSAGSLVAVVGLPFPVRKPVAGREVQYLVRRGGTLHLSWPFDGTALITLADAQGRIVLRQHFPAVQRSLVIPLPTNLACGLYATSITNTHGTVQRRVLVLLVD